MAVSQVALRSADRSRDGGTLTAVSAGTASVHGTASLKEIG
ncbi:hypothetical protein [Parafrankia discariae]|nr:hypothetical protein [Parafrankia discariae]